MNRAVAATFDALVQGWRDTNSGQPLPRSQAKLISHVAYRVPKVELVSSNTTYLLESWKLHSHFGNLPFPFPSQVVGATTPPLFGVVGLVMQNEKAFSWASLANYWLYKVSTFATPWKALRSLSIVMGQMQGDPKMTVEDNVQACQVMQDFVAVHGGSANVKPFLRPSVFLTRRSRSLAMLAWSPPLSLYSLWRRVDSLIWARVRTTKAVLFSRT